MVYNNRKLKILGGMPFYEIVLNDEFYNEMTMKVQNRTKKLTLIVLKEGFTSLNIFYVQIPYLLINFRLLSIQQS